MVNTIKFSQFDPINLNNLTNTMVGTTDPSGGSNIKTDFTTAWTTTTRPMFPYEGLQGYNATLGVPEYWDGLAWVPLAGGTGGGGITQINTGTGLTGGPITTTGTVSFADIAAMSLWANVTGAVAVPTVVPLSDFLLSSNNLSELTNLSNARTNLFLSATTGTAGQILTSNGAVIAPTWQDVGAGTVGIGNINEIAHYPVTGTSVTGLPTQNLGVLVTDATGVPSISAGGQIPGTTTNNVANAGNIGEVVESAYSSGIIMTVPNVVSTLASISLAPGDYDVWGNFSITTINTTTPSRFSLGVSLSASTVPAPSSSQTASTVKDSFAFVAFPPDATLGTTGTSIIKIPSGPAQTVYLNAVYTEPVSPGLHNFDVGGIIIARRRR